jgi:hypothetical protein
MKNTNRITEILIISTALLCGIILLFMKSIKQDEHYHHFADERTLCIPNAWNVWTNLAFLLVGLWGFYLYIKHSARGSTFQKINYVALYSGIILTAFGSTYYHWHPTGETLLWDRIPMTLVFASFFSIVVTDATSEIFGKKILLAFLVIGSTSILLWQLNGDLRLYVFAQFFPGLMIIILLLLRKIPENFLIYFYGILISYVIAKVFEHYDIETYEILHQNISGHSLKHLFASVTTCFIVKYTIFRISKFTNQ